MGTFRKDNIFDSVVSERIEATVGEEMIDVGAIFKEVLNEAIDENPARVALLAAQAKYNLDQPGLKKLELFVQEKIMTDSNVGMPDTNLGKIATMMTITTMLDFYGQYLWLFGEDGDSNIEILDSQANAFALPEPYRDPLQYERVGFVAILEFIPLVYSFNRILNTVRLTTEAVAQAWDIDAFVQMQASLGRVIIPVVQKVQSEPDQDTDEESGHFTFIHLFEAKTYPYNSQIDDVLSKQWDQVIDLVEVELADVNTEVISRFTETNNG